ncbi:GGDEF domain-containing protein [Undibacterium arcticum]
MILFYGMFRSGLHRRFREPTLTLPVICAATFTMLLVAYLNRSTEISLDAFMLTAFLFGIFHLDTRRHILLAVGWLSAYLLVILLRGYQQGSATEFQHDLMRWVVLCLLFAGLIVIAIQIRNLLARLASTQDQLEHVQERAVRDELTGSYNRHRLNHELTQAKHNADTQSVPFCICLIDIDHFKIINDDNGHQIGDRILREFVKVAHDSIRATDVFGRYGGDEFMHLLLGSELKGAVMHAERLRVHAGFLDLQPILHKTGISVSIGVAQYRDGETIGQLIERADSALYRAKKLGRNRVEWEQ